MTQITNKPINQIYDKIFKKILTLSGPAVINLVNGLFDTNHPLDSKLTYNWTEFIDTELKKVLADTIITINDKYPYHIEAQIENDNDIVFRVFDYGYKHAELNKEKPTNINVNYRLRFPEPKIIYLNSNQSTPDKYTLEIDFGTQGSFLYTVNTFKFLETSTEELLRKKMIILIPFKLLSLKNLINKKRSKENINALHRLISNDIIGSIRDNVSAGNITVADGIKLQSMTKRLYNYLYSEYKEMEEVEEMTDESIMFPIDILEKKYETIIAEKDNMLSEKDNIINEKDNMLSTKDNIISEKDNMLSTKDNEIARLKEELQKLKKQ